MTLTDDEAYLAFIAIDDRAWDLNGKCPLTAALREKLLPAYRAWHAAHPFQIHPSAISARAVLTTKQAGDR